MKHTATQEIQEQLRPRLRPDEHVLWAAKPDVSAATARKLLASAVQGLLLGLVSSALVTAIVALADRSTLDGTQNWFILLYVGAATTTGFIVILVGLGVLNLVSLRKRTYALTDQGFLWMSEVEVNRVGPHQIYNVEVQHHRDGTGTITFLGVVEAVYDEWVTRLQFEALWDVDEVVALARQVAQQAGYERKEPTLASVLTSIVGRATTMLLAAIVATAMLFGVSWVIGRKLPLQGPLASLQLPALFGGPEALSNALCTMLVASLLFFWGVQAEDAARRSGRLHWLALFIAGLKWASAAVAVGAIWWLIVLV